MYLFCNIHMCKRENLLENYTAKNLWILSWWQTLSTFHSWDGCTVSTVLFKLITYIIFNKLNETGLGYKDDRFYITGCQTKEARILIRLTSDDFVWVRKVNNSIQVKIIDLWAPYTHFRNANLRKIVWS